MKCPKCGNEDNFMVTFDTKGSCSFYLSRIEDGIAIFLPADEETEDMFDPELSCFCGYITQDLPFDDWEVE